MSEIKNLKAVEIHNIIGTFLKSNLTDFNFNKKRKRLERENDIKTDIIGWTIGKYQKESLLIVSFTAMIRHNFVDTIAERICDDAFFTRHSIYNDFIGELGNTDKKAEFNHYHIHTKDELMIVLDEVAHFFQHDGMNYFNKYAEDNDFFKFYCIEKNYGIGYSFLQPSVRRAAFCKLLNKYEMIGEINDFNIKCLTEGEKYIDNITRYYYEKMRLLEEYFNNNTVRRLEL
jgi:hypothetical protein